MKEFEHTVQNELGMHARPAGLLVKKAGEFSSSVTVNNGEKKVDAKKIMSLMMLGAKKEHTLEFSVEGSVEEAAAKALQTCGKDNL